LSDGQDVVIETIKMSRDVNNRKPKHFLSQLFLVFVIMSFLVAEGIVGILILQKATPHPQSRLFLYLLPLLLLMPLLRCLWGYKTIKREVIGKDVDQSVLNELRYVFASICAIAYAVVIVTIIAVR
jgi:hypothetical protein